MILHEHHIQYRDGDSLLEGFLCSDPSRPGPLPAVIIAHTWAGRNEFVERKARRLAWHGFAAFCLDMYGQGRRGQNPEESRALMTPLMQDRALLIRRVNAALTAVKALPQVDERRVAAVGFCFGGLCVLDLARSGADFRGAVSIHGLLKSPGLQSAPQIHAKVLLLHGYEDPLSPPEEILAAAKEFTEAGVDWQLHAFGHTLHGFINPQANDPAGGLQYSPQADRRSWGILLQFLDEVLR